MFVYLAGSVPGSDMEKIVRPLKKNVLFTPENTNATVRMTQVCFITVILFKYFMQLSHLQETCMCIVTFVVLFFSWTFRFHVLKLLRY